MLKKRWNVERPGNSIVEEQKNQKMFSKTSVVVRAKKNCWFLIFIKSVNTSLWYCFSWNKSIQSLSFKVSVYRNHHNSVVFCQIDIICKNCYTQHRFSLNFGFRFYLPSTSKLVSLLFRRQINLKIPRSLPLPIENNHYHFIIYFIYVLVICSRSLTGSKFLVLKKIELEAKRAFL